MASASLRSKSKSTKESFRSSADAYDKIKQNLIKNSAGDGKSYFLGYDDDSSKGIKEMPFDLYVPGGDIPWHKIYYFRKNNEMLWDRRNRIDKIFDENNDQQQTVKHKRKIRKQYDTLDDAASGDSSFDERDNDKKSDAKAKINHNNWLKRFELLPDHCFFHDHSTGRWKSVPTTPISVVNHYDGGRLRLVSYNVLFGLNGLDVETSEDERIPALLDCLRSTDADVICLQEVTEKLLSIILKRDWIRDNYFVSHDNLTYRSLMEPCGQFTFSKFPFAQISAYHFGPQKRFITVEIQLDEKRKLKITNIHLTSTKRDKDDHVKAEFGVKMRLHQMSTALSLADDDCATFVVGDFNFGDDNVEFDELKRLMQIYNYYDAWQSANPENPGYTYNPATNVMSAFRAKKYFEPRRLDRLLIRNSNAFNVSVDSVVFLGLEPIQRVEPNASPLFISDHYGLLLTFTLS